MSIRRLKIILPFVALCSALVAADQPDGDMDLVNQWLAQDNPNPKWRSCPSAKYSRGDPTTGRNPSEARNPFFGYGETLATFGCEQSGPYLHDGEKWWIQLISDIKGSGEFTGMVVDAIRACSPTRVVPDGMPPIPKPGPCRSAKGVGPRGCEVCARTVRAAGT